VLDFGKSVSLGGTVIWVGEVVGSLLKGPRGGAGPITCKRPVTVA